LATYLEVRARDDEGGERDDDDRPPAGAADDFQTLYGVALPPEARTLFAAAPPASTLHELRLGPTLPETAADNVFEHALAAPRALADAFAGAFQIGEQRGGDTVHLELYEWDGARQVLRFDRRAGAFAGVCADSLDSLVYLATLVQAGEAGELNQLIPPDQLAARFEACERVIPTALYAMWRAYLWDEPELDRYLEIGRRH